MKNKDAFFLISRSLLEHPIWLKGTFSKGQAWVDLIGLANFADKEFYDGGKLEVVRRGQIKASLSYFAKRWNWKRETVRRYFLALNVAGMVTLDVTPKGTTITLENYDTFQNRRGGNRSGKRDRERTTEGATDGATVIKNIKNNKEYINNSKSVMESLKDDECKKLEMLCSSTSDFVALLDKLAIIPSENIKKPFEYAMAVGVNLGYITAPSKEVKH